MRLYFTKHDVKTEIKIILFTVSVVIIAICSYYSHILDIYSDVAIVSDVDRENDIVTMKCSDGNLYTISGIEDWMVDDLVALKMDNSGTATRTDDVVLHAYYRGRLEDF